MFWDVVILCFVMAMICFIGWESWKLGVEEDAKMLEKAGQFFVKFFQEIISLGIMILGALTVWLVVQISFTNVFG